VATNEWDSSTRVALTTFDVNAGLASFRLLCADSGISYHCSTDHPGHNGTVWHAGEGVLSVSSRRVQVRYDNLQTAAGVADANFTNVTFNGTVRRGE
jgi:hypothetical protein